MFVVTRKKNNVRETSYKYMDPGPPGPLGPFPYLFVVFFNGELGFAESLSKDQRVVNRDHCDTPTAFTRVRFFGCQGSSKRFCPHWLLYICLHQPNLKIVSKYCLG